MTAAGIIPGIGIGSNQDTEHLFASPQLRRLEYGGSGQVNMLIGVAPVRTQFGEVTPAVEAVFGVEQERRCQEVLQCKAQVSTGQL